MSARRLLLVDSDPAVHEHLNSLLKREDRTIQDVYDPSEALARLRRSSCDLVVAGQGRNGFDGLKLLRRVRAIHPDAKVIVTGEPDPGRVRRPNDWLRHREKGASFVGLQQNPRPSSTQRRGVWPPVSH